MDDAALPELAISIQDPEDMVLAVAITAVPERPPTPHRTSPASESESARAQPPVISPQLSPEDQARAESDTNAAIDTARRNLNSVSGRRMNATQQDLADKIRGFMERTRDAVSTGDWLRARDFSEKARVLSIELAHSF